MASDAHSIEAVLPKSGAASAALELDRAGVTTHEFHEETDRSGIGPHDVFVVVDVTGHADEAEQIIIRHGGRLVHPHEDD